MYSLRIFFLTPYLQEHGENPTPRNNFYSIQNNPRPHPTPSLQLRGQVRIYLLGAQILYAYICTGNNRFLISTFQKRSEPQDLNC